MTKTTKLLICIAASSALTGCKQSFQEKQLFGSWKHENPVADIRFTYYPNHSWIMIVSSSDERVPNGSEFGDWKLEGNRVIVTTRCTLNNEATSTSEAGIILKLNSSDLVEKITDANGQIKTTAFHKINGPVTSVSDDELAKKLAGTWIFSYTNATKLTGALLYSAYELNSTANWHGTIYKKSQSLPMPEANGIWRVEDGHLVTIITNSLSNQLPTNKETRDQILSVTDSQFTYRDEQDTIKKVLRKN